MARNMMAWGQEWLAGQLREHASVEVAYARGQTTLAFPATIGRTVFASNLEKAARVEFGEIDFLISVDDLAPLQGPAEGDRIAATIRGQALLFEIMAPGGEPPWRYSDPQRTQYRVHCKRVVT